jgi:thioredoxin 1
MYAKFKDLGPSVDSSSASNKIQSQQTNPNAYAATPPDLNEKNISKPNSFANGPVHAGEYVPEQMPYQNQSAPLFMAGFPPAPPQFQNPPAPQFQNPPAPPQFQNPPAPPQFQNPPAPQFQNYAAPHFQNPPTPPQFQNYAAPQFQNYSAPQFQNPPAPTPLAQHAPIVESVSDLNRKNEIINSNKLVVIDVFGSWCNPCKAIDEPYKKLAEKYNSLGTCMLIKEDVDLGLQQPDGVKIKGVPAFLFFVNGKYDGMISGADISGVEHMIKTLSSKTI